MFVFVLLLQKVKDMQDTSEFREVVIGLCEEAIDNQAKQINSIEEKLKV